MPMSSWAVIHAENGVWSTPIQPVINDRWKTKSAIDSLPASMFNLFSTYHMPNVSPKRNIRAANPTWSASDAANTSFSRFASSIPSWNVMNLTVPCEIYPLRNASNETKPPTTLYSPKSLKPRALRMMRDVNKDMNIVSMKRP